MVWDGKAHELGRLILELRRYGLRSSSDLDACERASRHFVKPDGRPYKGSSLLQGLRQKQEKLSGYPKK